MGRLVAGQAMVRAARAPSPVPGSSMVARRDPAVDFVADTPVYFTLEGVGQDVEAYCNVGWSRGQGRGERDAAGLRSDGIGPTTQEGHPGGGRRVRVRVDQLYTRLRQQLLRRTYCYIDPHGLLPQLQQLSAGKQPSTVEGYMNSGPHQLVESENGEADESRLCLLDVACTACMHSRRWREAYEKSLPEGLQCTPTTQRKSFHFANGSSTEEQAVVWKVPIFLKGHRGEVFSAEIKNGNTPLLLSIAAMVSLNMLLFVKDRKVKIQELQLEVDMIITRTKHFGHRGCLQPKVSE